MILDIISFKYLAKNVAIALDYCNLLFVPCFHNCSFTDDGFDKSMEEISPSYLVVGFYVIGGVGAHAK